MFKDYAEIQRANGQLPEGRGKGLGKMGRGRSRLPVLKQTSHSNTRHSIRNIVSDTVTAI